jgi:hypothetical protein
MSEYQYYEWQTIDRALTAAEQAAVNKLSSHIDVTSTRAWVEYHWSDFKHDPKQVLARTFDAFLYYANWAGSGSPSASPRASWMRRRSSLICGSTSPNSSPSVTL